MQLKPEDFMYEISSNNIGEFAILCVEVISMHVSRVEIILYSMHEIL
jgi:hypothetical protein